MAGFGFGGGIIGGGGGGGTVIIPAPARVPVISAAPFYTTPGGLVPDATLVYNEAVWDSATAILEIERSNLVNNSLVSRADNMTITQEILAGRILQPVERARNATGWSQPAPGPLVIVPSEDGGPIDLDRAAYDAATTAGTLILNRLYIVTEASGDPSYFFVEAGGPVEIGGEDTAPTFSLTAPVVAQLADETVAILQPGNADIDPEYGTLVSEEHIIRQGSVPLAQESDLPWQPTVSLDGEDVYAVYLAVIQTSTIRITASIESDPITIAVTTQEPPIITGPAIGSVLENTTAISTYTFNRPVTLFVTGADAARISVPTGVVISAAVAFIAAPDYEDPTNATTGDQNGDRIYDFTLNAVDAANPTLIGTFSASINVVNVAEAPYVIQHAEFDGGLNVGDRITRRTSTFGGTLPHTFQFNHWRTDAQITDRNAAVVAGPGVVLIAGPTAPATYDRTAADAVKWLHREVICTGPEGSARSISSGNGPGAAVVVAPPVDPNDPLPPESEWVAIGGAQAAVDAASSAGGTIVLAPGNHGRLTISGRTFTAPLIIRSGRVSDPAYFQARASDTGITHAAALRIIAGCNNIHLRDIGNRYTPTAQSTHSGRVVEILDSSNITLTNVDVEGGNGLNTNGQSQNPWALGFGTGYGLYISGCTNVRIAGGKSSTLYYGLVAQFCTNFFMHDREFEFINCDAANFTGMTDLILFRNDIHDMRRSNFIAADGSYLHADVFQFQQTVGNPLSRHLRVAVLFNKIQQNAGTHAQTFIVGDEQSSRSGIASERSQDFYFRWNYVNNSHAIGLLASGVERLWALENTFVQNPRAPAATAPDPRLWITNCIDAIADKNISATPTFSGNTGASSHTGTIVATPPRGASAGNYPSLFVGPFGNDRTIAQMAAIPGGTIYAADAGAPHTRPNDPLPTFEGFVLPWGYVLHDPDVYVEPEEPEEPVDPPIVFPDSIAVLFLSQSEPNRVTEEGGTYNQLPHPPIPFDNRFRIYRHSGSGHGSQLNDGAVGTLIQRWMTQANRNLFNPAMTALAAWCQWRAPNTIVHLGEAHEAGSSWLDMIDETNPGREAKDTWDVANALYAANGKIDRAHAFWIAADRALMAAWSTHMVPIFFRQTTGIPPQPFTLGSRVVTSNRNYELSRSIYNLNNPSLTDRGFSADPDGPGISEQALLSRDVPFDQSRLANWTERNDARYMNGYHTFIKDSRYQSLGGEYGPPGTAWSKHVDGAHPDNDRYDGVMIAMHRFMMPTIKRALGLPARESNFERCYTAADGSYTDIYINAKNGGSLDTYRRLMGVADPAVGNQEAYYQALLGFEVTRTVGGVTATEQLRRPGSTDKDIAYRGACTRLDGNRARIVWEKPIEVGEVVRLIYQYRPNYMIENDRTSTNRYVLNMPIEHVPANTDFAALYPYFGDLVRDSMDDWTLQLGYTTYTTSDEFGTSKRTPPAATLGAPSVVVTPPPSDTTAPVLTIPTDAATGATTATGTVSSNDSSGTLYVAVTAGLASAAPTSAQIKAGTGGGIIAANSKAVTASGEQTINVTGLTASTSYRLHFCQIDAAPTPNTSAVISGDGFTTTAAAAPAADMVPTFSVLAGDGQVDHHATYLALMETPEFTLANPTDAHYVVVANNTGNSAVDNQLTRVSIGAAGRGAGAGTALTRLGYRRGPSMRQEAEVYGFTGALPTGPVTIIREYANAVTRSSRLKVVRVPGATGGATSLGNNYSTSANGTGINPTTTVANSILLTVVAKLGGLLANRVTPTGTQVLFNDDTWDGGDGGANDCQFMIGYINAPTVGAYPWGFTSPVSSTWSVLTMQIPKA